MAIEFRRTADAGPARVEPARRTGGSTEPARGQPLPVDGKDAPRPAPPPSDLSRVISNLNQFLKDSRRDLRFQVDESSGRTIITIVNPDTGEIVRQIPPEEVLSTARTLREAGLLLNAKA